MTSTVAASLIPALAATAIVATIAAAAASPTTTWRGDRGRSVDVADGVAEVGEPGIVATLQTCDDVRHTRAPEHPLSHR